MHQNTRKSLHAPWSPQFTRESVGIKDGKVVDDGGIAVNNYSSFQVLFLDKIPLLRLLSSESFLLNTLTSGFTRSHLFGSHYKGQIFLHWNLVVQLQPFSGMSQTAAQETRRWKLERIWESLLTSFCIKKQKGKGANFSSSLVLEPRPGFTSLGSQAFDKLHPMCKMLNEEPFLVHLSSPQTHEGR